MLIRRWCDGKDAALDVTVTSPLASSNLVGFCDPLPIRSQAGNLSSSNLAAAATRPGGALEKAYDRKMRDTSDTCRQQGLVFLPIALETPW